MNIVDNIEKIVQSLSVVNHKVELVAATKTRTIDEVQLAMSSKLIAASGENRVQELLSKYDDSITWDFIGQLQTNKVKYIIDKVRLIHSVDRYSLAKTIDKEAKKNNKVQDVLVQINAGKEESKGGIFLEDIHAFLDEIAYFENIQIRGVMAVVPLDYDDDQLKRTFDKVYAKYSQLKTNTFSYLSMGMSNDYLIAVESGANLIRLGRAIFGQRG
ncbi:MAG: YggS family pyridoxal phosphate-dependent enzyme [Clostridiales bacterium]|nr:YggS family pyridoxal phosphate-dependent enzyme [Clostridiales bacterium]